MKQSDQIRLVLTCVLVFFLVGLLWSWIRS
jgi:hypothetical protein